MNVFEHTVDPDTAHTLLRMRKLIDAAEADLRRAEDERRTQREAWLSRAAATDAERAQMRTDAAEAEAAAWQQAPTEAAVMSDLNGSVDSSAFPSALDGLRHAVVVSGAPDARGGTADLVHPVESQPVVESATSDGSAAAGGTDEATGAQQRRPPALQITRAGPLDFFDVAVGQQPRNPAVATRAERLRAADANAAAAARATSGLSNLSMTSADAAAAAGGSVGGSFAGAVSEMVHQPGVGQPASAISPEKTHVQLGKFAFAVATGLAECRSLAERTLQHAEHIGTHTSDAIAVATVYSNRERQKLEREAARRRRQDPDAELDALMVEGAGGKSKAATATKTALTDAEDTLERKADEAAMAGEAAATLRALELQRSAVRLQTAVIELLNKLHESDENVRVLHREVVARDDAVAAVQAKVDSAKEGAVAATVERDTLRRELWTMRAGAKLRVVLNRRLRKAAENGARQVVRLRREVEAKDATIASLKEQVAQLQAAAEASASLVAGRSMERSMAFADSTAATGGASASGGANRGLAGAGNLATHVPGVHPERCVVHVAMDDYVRLHEQVPGSIDRAVALFHACVQQTLVDICGAATAAAHAALTGGSDALADAGTAGGPSSSTSLLQCYAGMDSPLDDMYGVILARSDSGGLMSDADGCYYLIGFSAVSDAMRFAVTLQTVLHCAAWPADLATVASPVLPVVSTKDLPAAAGTRSAAAFATDGSPTGLTSVIRSVEHYVKHVRAEQEDGTVRGAGAGGIKGRSSGATAAPSPRHGSAKSAAAPPLALDACVAVARRALDAAKQNLSSSVAKAIDVSRTLFGAGSSKRAAREAAAAMAGAPPPDVILRGLRARVSVHYGPLPLELVQVPPNVARQFVVSEDSSASPRSLQTSPHSSPGRIAAGGGDADGGTPGPQQDVLFADGTKVSGQRASQVTVCYGDTPMKGALLCRAAHGGEILVSEAARAHGGRTWAHSHAFGQSIPLSPLPSAHHPRQQGHGAAQHALLFEEEEVAQQVLPPTLAHRAVFYAAMATDAAVATAARRVVGVDQSTSGGSGASVGEVRTDVALRDVAAVAYNPHWWLRFSNAPLPSAVDEHTLLALGTALHPDVIAKSAAVTPSLPSAPTESQQAGAAVASSSPGSPGGVVADAGRRDSGAAVAPHRPSSSVGMTAPPSRSATPHLDSTVRSTTSNAAANATPTSSGLRRDSDPTPPPTAAIPLSGRLTPFSAAASPGPAAAGGRQHRGSSAGATAAAIVEAAAPQQQQLAAAGVLTAATLPATLVAQLGPVPAGGELRLGLTSADTYAMMSADVALLRRGLAFSQRQLRRMARHARVAERANESREGMLMLANDQTAWEAFIGITATARADSVGRIRTLTLGGVPKALVDANPILQALIEAMTTPDWEAVEQAHTAMAVPSSAGGTVNAAMHPLAPLAATSPPFATATTSSTSDFHASSAASRTPATARATQAPRAERCLTCGATAAFWIMRREYVKVLEAWEWDDAFDAMRQSRQRIATAAKLAAASTTPSAQAPSSSPLTGSGGGGDSMHLNVQQLQSPMSPSSPVSPASTLAPQPPQQGGGGAVRRRARHTSFIGGGPSAGAASPPRARSAGAKAQVSLPAADAANAPAAGPSVVIEPSLASEASTAPQSQRQPPRLARTRSRTMAAGRGGPDTTSAGSTRALNEFEAKSRKASVFALSALRNRESAASLVSNLDRQFGTPSLFVPRLVAWWAVSVRHGGDPSVFAPGMPLSRALRSSWNAFVETHVRRLACQRPQPYDFTADARLGSASARSIAEGDGTLACHASAFAAMHGAASVDDLIATLLLPAGKTVTLLAPESPVELLHQVERHRAQHARALGLSRQPTSGVVRQTTAFAELRRMYAASVASFNVGAAAAATVTGSPSSKIASSAASSPGKANGLEADAALLAMLEGGVGSTAPSSPEDFSVDHSTTVVPTAAAITTGQLPESAMSSTDDIAAAVSHVTLGSLRLRGQGTACITRCMLLDPLGCVLGGSGGGTSSTADVFRHTLRRYEVQRRLLASAFRELPALQMAVLPTTAIVHDEAAAARVAAGGDFTSGPITVSLVAHVGTTLQRGRVPPVPTALLASEGSSTRTSGVVWLTARQWLAATRQELAEAYTDPDVEARADGSEATDRDALDAYYDCVLIIAWRVAMALEMLHQVSMTHGALDLDSVVVPRSLGVMPPRVAHNHMSPSVAGGMIAALRTAEAWEAVLAFGGASQLGVPIDRQFIAPELLDAMYVSARAGATGVATAGVEPTPQTDVWAFGVTVFAMATISTTTPGRSTTPRAGVSSSVTPAEAALESFAASTAANLPAELGIGNARDDVGMLLSGTAAEGSAAAEKKAISRVTPCFTTPFATINAAGGQGDLTIRVSASPAASTGKGSGGGMPLIDVVHIATLVEVIETQRRGCRANALRGRLAAHRTHNGVALIPGVTHRDGTPNRLARTPTPAWLNTAVTRSLVFDPEKRVSAGKLASILREARTDLATSRVDRGGSTSHPGSPSAPTAAGSPSPGLGSGPAGGRMSVTLNSSREGTSPHRDLLSPTPTIVLNR